MTVQLWKTLAAIFQQVLSMSLTACPVILVVCLARLGLKRAPKKFSYWLWAPAAFRLACPFSFPAVFSLFALTPAETVTDRGALTEVSYLPDAYSALAGVLPPVSDQGQAYVAGAPIPGVSDGARGPGLMEVLGVVWVLGILAMLILAAVSWLRLRRQVATAVRFSGRAYQCDQLRAPFVLGLFRPKIYLPFGLEPRQQECVLCHEEAHIRRGDHLAKPLAFLLLAVHWFNPLAWLAFRLMSRDMEMSCDEKVLAQMGEDAREAYSLSLLSIGMNRRLPAPNPLAFGETGIKERVRNVMRFRRAKSWVTAAAALAVAAVTAACAANPGGGSLLSGLAPDASPDTGAAGSTASSALATGLEDVVDAHTLEVLEQWLDQPDQELVALYRQAVQSAAPLVAEGGAEAEAETAPDSPAASEEAQAELDAYLREAFPPSYFTENGYQSFTGAMMQAYLFHQMVGEGSMELVDLERTQDPRVDSTRQWTATLRVQRPDGEGQDIALGVSVQAEGDRIASLRLDQEGVNQLSAYFQGDPFLSPQAQIERERAQQEEVFREMVFLQDEMAALEAEIEEQPGDQGLQSQLEEARDRWQQLFDQYDSLQDSIDRAWEDLGMEAEAESSAASQAD